MVSSSWDCSLALWDYASDVPAEDLSSYNAPTRAVDSVSALQDEDAQHQVGVEATLPDGTRVIIFHDHLAMAADSGDESYHASSSESDGAADEDSDASD